MSKKIHDGQTKAKRWRVRNRAAFLRSARSSNLRRNYGLSLQDYENMLQKQNGHCATCTRTPHEEYHGVLHVDHDHVTRKVRGLLCTRCNSILGYAYENPQTLTNLVLWLRQHGE
jgi:hypothetical protein